MLDERRWAIEREIMRRRFPWIQPFEMENGCVGFFGVLRGPKTGQRYEILIKIPANLYPETEPPIYLEPRIGGNWRADNVNRNPNGKLCYDRPGSEVWHPARGTFANCVLVAADYLRSQGA